MLSQIRIRVLSAKKPDAERNSDACQGHVFLCIGIIRFPRHARYERQ